MPKKSKTLPKTGRYFYEIGGSFKQMRKIISISEAMQIPNSTGHVLASGDSFYNEDKGEIEVNLKVTQPGNEEIKIEGFEPQTIKMKIDLEEAIPATKDIFRSWIKRILKTGLVTVEK